MPKPPHADALEDDTETAFDPNLLPLIEAALASAAINPPIPGGLKAKYRASQLRAARRHNRFCVVALTFLFDLFWLAQFRSAPELVWLSGILRFTIFTPMALLFLVLDGRRRPGRFHEAALVTISAAAALITALQCVRTTSLTTLSDIRAAPLILLTTGLVMRLPPRACTVNAVISVTAFVGSILLCHVVPRAELGSLIFTDLAIGAACWGFSNMLERRDRCVFLLRASDSIRRATLAAQNLDLRCETETDALTGVANRRCFDRFLAASWRQGLRAGDWVGLIMIDLDHFKKFNDHYGHQGGDDCLRRVADQAAGQIRAGDLFARYGGEEFAVVLPAAPLLTVAAVAERIRDSVASLALPHATRPDGAIVTVTLGIASVVPTDPQGVRRLVELADQNLYEAKRCGRDRVGGERVAVG